MPFDQSTVQIALEQIENLRETGQLSGLIHNLRSLLTATNLAYHGLFVPGRIADDRLIAVTYSRAWQERYVTENYFRTDPVEVAARSISEPLDWNSVRFVSKETEAFFADAENHGVGHNGLSIPLIDRRGGRALFSLVSNLRGQRWEAFKTASLPALIKIGKTIQERTNELIRQDANTMAAAGLITPLTRRETEFLTLYVAGWEIKEIRDKHGVSDTAVRDVLNAAADKLKAKGPRHAGYMALTLGIIEPHLVQSTTGYVVEARVLFPVKV